MFIRSFFVLQRFFGYGVVFLGLLWNHLDRPWWQWLIGISAWMWGTLEHWKRPDETPRVMRRGVGVEAGMIAIWAISFHNASILFLLISPAARTGIHLGWRDSTVTTACFSAFVLTSRFVLPPSAWMPWVEFAAVLGASGYSLVLGELIRERDRLSREVQLSAFDREQRAKNEERVRLAGQLHDTMGQYWTAVIRALDVAEQVTGDQQRTFIGKARNAALEGLSAMREATHTWNDGRQTPREWLQYAEDALRRLSDFVGLDTQFHASDIDWTRFEDRLRVAELLARALIESATNAIRHGAARRLVAVLRSDDTEVSLVVRDDGRGFGAGQKGRTKAWGLRRFGQSRKKWAGHSAWRRFVVTEP
ncbi:hypothetical protein GCM10025857_26870 [Alicyclobacillus contaminans]|nr:hypothetical protein GCM10025857_26870 [Alicyclobacillus contaminans]